MSSWKVMANIPDQDHIRSWHQIGTCQTLEEFEEIKEKEINFWQGTSNVLRLRQPGSFELIKE